ncbi:MAG: prepilin-type N-terminal cleavage/methylation domain-containing protein [Parcubacteria group bacterium]|nr:prepilin-type N-terminal cleavage/methylation domain-containing protein [Parcubacteria group bacterium]
MNLRKCIKKTYEQIRKNFARFSYNFVYVRREGFSLVELLVTVSIFVIVTSIVLINFPSFSSKIALDNLAHEVALSVRQAQVFGVSSKESAIGSGIFPSHGAHFDINQNAKFSLFIDIDENNKYTGESELSETFNIQRRNYISEICGFLTSASSCTPLDVVDIVFTRPNPEPTLLGKVGVSENLYSYATITISSPSGATRSVVVWSNGQIAIQ